jgi:hypothetical protein
VGSSVLLKKVVYREVRPPTPRTANNMASIGSTPHTTVTIDLTTAAMGSDTNVSSSSAAAAAAASEGRRKDPTSQKRKGPSGEDPPDAGVQNEKCKKQRTETETEAEAETKTDANVPSKENERYSSRSLKELFTCPICHEWIDNAVETSCGHLFCKGCIMLQKMHRDRPMMLDDSQQCAVCRAPSVWPAGKELPNGWHRSHWIQREINQIPATCPHDGCDVRKPRGEMKAHAAQCACAPAKPPTPTIVHRVTVSRPHAGSSVSLARCPENAKEGDKMELQLEGVSGIRWQCIVPKGIRPNDLFNVCLTGVQEHLAASTGGGGLTSAAVAAYAAAAAAAARAGVTTAAADPRLRPIANDLWNAAYSDRYRRWYWWNTETRETTWEMPAPLRELQHQQNTQNPIRFVTEEETAAAVAAAHAAAAAAQAAAAADRAALTRTTRALERARAALIHRGGPGPVQLEEEASESEAEEEVVVVV